MKKLMTAKHPYILNEKVVANFYYKKGDNSVSEIIERYDKEYLKIIDFFGFNPNKIIEVRFLYRRSDMDKLWGEKSPRWLCGMVSPKCFNKVYIFSPLVFEKLTTHKIEEILPTLIHETCHVFISEICNRNFAWINEGVCQFLENSQRLYYDIKEDDWLWFKSNRVLTNKDICWSEVSERGGYKISFNLAKYIINNLGKKKVIELLKVRRSGQSRVIEESIEKILGESIDTFQSRFEKVIEITL